MVRRKTHQEYATFLIRSSPTFEHNSLYVSALVGAEAGMIHLWQSKKPSTPQRAMAC